MTEVDARVHDADGHAAAVGLRVVLHEVDRTGLEGRVVRVLRGGVLVRRRVGLGGGLLHRAGLAVRVGARVRQLDLVPQVDAVHRGQLGGRLQRGLGLAGGQGGAHVTEVVVRLAHRGALDRAELVRHLLGLAGGGRDHDGDVRVTLGLGLLKEFGVGRTELLVGGLDRGRGARGVRAGRREDGPGAGGRESGDQTGRGRDARDASGPGYGAGGFEGHQHPW